MNNILLSPPAAFVIVLAAMLALSKFLSLISAKPKTHGEGMEKSYGCGEDAPANMAQPDYSQFFPFAFFFTILHVFTLTIATIPVLNPGSFAIAIVYALAAIISLVILFRR